MTSWTLTGSLLCQGIVSYAMAASIKSSSRTKGLVFYLFNDFEVLNSEESSGSHRGEWGRYAEMGRS